jgi:hypothetical protein
LFLPAVERIGGAAIGIDAQAAVRQRQ